MILDDNGTLSLPAPVQGNRDEGILLISEARQHVRETRAEHTQPVKNYTGSRLFKERPRLYRLVAAMLAENLSHKTIKRATLCDNRTIKSVEYREAESIPTMKRKLTTGFGQLAKMTLERLQEVVPDMNHAQLAVTSGIATDKFTVLTGDANFRIEHTITDNRANIFERMAQLQAGLMKVVQGKVIEAELIEG